MSSNYVKFLPPILAETRVQQVKKRIIELVTPEMQKITGSKASSREALRQRLESAMNSIGVQNMPADVHELIITSALADLIGYGPLEWLLHDEQINEIMVNGPDMVFIERNSELWETDIHFESENHIMQIIDRILLPLGRRVDYDNPTADARLPDGSRVNIAIRPVSVNGPLITIRKFLRNKMTSEDFVELGTMTSYMATFLKACVVSRMNILISGNTSSGKSTMLNVLSTYIPENERIITIEDAVELQMTQRHVIQMETKLPSVDGTGAVTIRDLVRNALRMRPDRLVVGEVRGGETLDMLQAMNTGHSGSLTTIHANTPRDAIARLETTALMSGIDLPVMALRRQISSALDLIVHMSRLPDGSRKATQITEVVGMEGDIVTLTDIYKFHQTGVAPDGKVKGELRPTGIRPVFNPRLEVSGFKLGGEYFGLGF
ncbi:MAG: type II secretion system protein E [Chloroflexi bacterium HGW-Chloroflexi-6]|nr:MAG: type II secretion system protein E [Chloroflexi bacterium HGW-Chloroflexi-6]